MSIESIAGLIRRAESRKWDPDSRVDLEFSADSITLDELKAIDVEVRHLSLSGEDRTRDFLRGEELDLAGGFQLSLRAPRVARTGVVVRDLDDLLSLAGTCRKAPLAYYLVREDVLWTGKPLPAEAPEAQKQYHQALEVVQILDDLKDYESPAGNLLFFHLRRFEIAPSFDTSDLGHDIRSEDLRDFFVTDSAITSLRRDLFRSVLAESLRGIEPEKALGHLLRRSDDLVLRLNESHAVYLADHSPERLNEEAQERRLALAEKLEKVISGIETRALTIPAAVLLGIKELKFGEGTTTLNVIILLAMVYFALAMLAAWIRQSSLLDLMKTEVEQAASDLAAKGLDERNPFLKDIFPALAARSRQAKIWEFVLMVISWGPLLVCLWATFFACPLPPDP